MFLPPELAWLCSRLSSVPSTELPRHTPDLMHLMQRCQSVLSSPNATKTTSSISSELSVLVHKLKTQISSLLQGKTAEGRFAAVVLVKGIVEVGGWEILHDSEKWVQGLLSILTKKDSVATKELSILTLTKLYSMNHQYQTLNREITTPTLPTFITNCVNLVSKASSANDVPPKLAEIIFWSFSVLLLRHTTIYRPFATQIRLLCKPYLAPTLSDGFVPYSLQRSARRLTILLHQTVPKNGGGEEWGKSVREIVKETHITADLVFRAVIEAWESTTGYISNEPPLTHDLSGGGDEADSLSRWTGIGAGTQRIIGLLGILKEYFTQETSMPVTIPLGIIIDLLDRILVMLVPSSVSSKKMRHDDETVRLRPGIDREEQNGLWSGMPKIYVAALELISTIADRLQSSFLIIAQGFLDRIIWVFQSGKHDPGFRRLAYEVLAKILPHVGSSLGPQSVNLSEAIKACCHDLHPIITSEPTASALTSNGKNANGKRPLADTNTNTFLHGSSGAPRITQTPDIDLLIAAGTLLPLLISHVPQQTITITNRGILERTAVLSKNKTAMLACLLNPWVGKNGLPVLSILPYAAREFSEDQMIELLLRPRMPMVPLAGADLDQEVSTREESEDDEDEIMGEQDTPNAEQLEERVISGNIATFPGLGPAAPAPEPPANLFSSVGRNQQASSPGPSTSQPSFLRSDAPQPEPIPTQGESSVLLKQTIAPAQPEDILPGAAQESESDDESVQLVMELDTDSEEDL